MPGTVIYPARLVRTLDRGRPTATAVAVRGDRVLAVGALDELGAYGDHTIDDRFAEAVIVPGFVEAHAHSYAGALWQSPYVGYFPRTGPDGRFWEGCHSIDALVEQLVEAERALPDDAAPLTAWGFDPIYLGSTPLGAAELDRISRTRPIFVLHASNHLASVNSAVIVNDGLAGKTQIPGVVTDPAGRPTGELREFAAMFQASPVLDLLAARGTAAAFDAFAALAHRCGCTTVADLGGTPLSDPAVLDALAHATARADFPVRLSMFHLAAQGPTPIAEEVALVAGLEGCSTTKLRFGHVKLIIDGSIQGFTARLQPPGYLGERPNGMWITAPERLREAFGAFHEAGHLVHAHCNGDEATELFLEIVEQALARSPRWDHRHTATHSQLSTAAQYRRMATLGVGANIFANHTYYWGDQHRDVTVGPDRAARMNAAATALANGVTISLHSDEPVTPIGPLASMTHAVERTTASGALLGPAEAITAAQALEAVTLGSAYLLKMDHEIGSIEAGKLADLAVLDDDPLAVPAARIAHIAVRATVLGGQVLPVGPGAPR